MNRGGSDAEDLGHVKDMLQLSAVQISAQTAEKERRDAKIAAVTAQNALLKRQIAFMHSVQERADAAKNRNPPHLQLHVCDINIPPPAVASILPRKGDDLEYMGVLP